MSNTLPFHEWLRDSRKKLGVTQVQLAERMGSTQSAIVRLESGRHDQLLDKTVGGACKALGIAADIFVDTKGRVRVYKIDDPNKSAADPKTPPPAQATGTDG